MGLNDDRLSDREHSEMRDTVLAGTQRIKPAGAHRAQVIAGAVALVLVGGIAGGAVATAALLGSAPDTVASTPTPTPTPSVTAEPSPTATPTPTPVAPEVEAGGVMPFGGECANVLNDEEVDAVTGIDMIRSDYRWETGANAVRGAIDCLWVSEGEYLAARTNFYAFPEGQAPQYAVEMAEGCLEGADQVACTAALVVDGTWMQVRVAGDPANVTEAGARHLLAAAADRLGKFPAPVPATPTSEWWALLDCNALVAQIDPAVYGFERVALSEFGDDGVADDHSQPTTTCHLDFTSGSGDTATGELVAVSIVPGGAVSYHTAVEAEHAESVSVAGAQSAVMVAGNDRYEGSPDVLVVTDGVNTLMISPDWLRWESDVEPLAAALLAMMHP